MIRSLWGLYAEILGIITASARRFLLSYALLFGALSIVDAVALGLLALLVAPVAVGQTASLPIIGELDFTGLAIAIAVLCAFVILKGIASLGVLLWGVRRSEQYEIEIGSRLFSSFIRSPWESRLARNSADIVRFTDTSVSVAVTGFLVPGATLVSEAVSMVSILVIISIAQPVVALTTLLYLGVIGCLLYVWVAGESRRAGEVNLRFALITNRLILAMVSSMKEIALRAKLGEVAEVVESTRRRSTRARANLMFLGQVPRYALESGIVGGFVLVGVIGYLFDGPTGAITSVALFSVAGFRMAPSVVRVQSTLSQMAGNAPHARAILDEIADAERAHQQFTRARQQTLAADPKTVVFDNVSFSYQGASEAALTQLSFTIPIGSTVAFVGPSGAGKSTVVDMLLGFLQPGDGAVRVGEFALADVADAWRHQLGYVPQEVSIFDGSVAENVALSWTSQYDEQRVRQALQRASLLETIEARPGGINARVGERGLTLSGGQRQRLGIARALYSDPLVLIMDEATSALDVHTEAEVNQAIAELRGKTTLILVAHRLSTIMQADRIFYLRAGRLVAEGTFQELVAQVPDFAQQAELSGLA